MPKYNKNDIPKLDVAPEVLDELLKGAKTPEQINVLFKGLKKAMFHDQGVRVVEKPSANGADRKIRQTQGGVMARLPRPVLPGQPLHLTQRGNNRSATFFADEDFQYYRDTLHHASQRFGCAIHAYVLMTNHVHLLITPRDEQGPARMMQAVGRRYVRYINDYYRRTGTLWEGRYKSALIDTESYLLVCSRYIELNPVRARMVDDPARYRWSSYAYNATGQADPLITPHPVYHALGPSAADQRVAYRALFQTHLEPHTLDAIRCATNEGTIIGQVQFREQIEMALKRRIARATHGGDRRSKEFQMERE